MASPLYSWFSQVEIKGSNLAQGDIIRNIYVPHPNGDYTYKDLVKPPKTSLTDWQLGDWIILSQSCDLEPDNNKRVDEVTICPVVKFSDFIVDNPHLSGSSKKGSRESILKNQNVGFHALHPPGYRYSTEPLIVNLRLSRTIKFNVLVEHFEKTNRKMKIQLNAPYAEAMALRYGLLYFRIANRVAFPTKSDFLKFT